MSENMRPLTDKQTEILRVLCKLNADGSFVDLDQLLMRLSYDTSKQSMQFSIRALVSRGLIVKQPCENRRGRSRVVYAPTQLAYSSLFRE